MFLYREGVCACEAAGRGGRHPGGLFRISFSNASIVPVAMRHPRINVSPERGLASTSAVAARARLALCWHRSYSHQVFPQHMENVGAIDIGLIDGVMKGCATHNHLSLVSAWRLRASSSSACICSSFNWP